MHRRTILVTLILLAPASLVLALAVGSVPVDLATLWEVLRGTASGVPHTLVMELRLPRALLAFAVGGMLALAGSLLQVLLRNPLADPSVIGVSGGAAVATLAALLAGATGAVTHASAFAGALASMLLVFALSRSGP